MPASNKFKRGICIASYGVVVEGGSLLGVFCGAAGREDLRRG